MELVDEYAHTTGCIVAALVALLCYYYWKSLQRPLG